MNGNLQAASLALLVGLAGCADLRFGGEPAFDENLSVLVSDIHIQTHPDEPYAFTAAEFPRRVTEILAMAPRPRRVICFGDMTFNDGEPESYAFLRRQTDRLEQAGIRVVLGMGNHDCRKAFLESFPEAGKDQPVPGRIVYKVDLGHCDLILLDTLDARERAVGGEIGAEQEAWLRREVAAAKRPVILGAHHRPDELKVGGRPLLEFMRGSDKVVGWINGHGHYWHKENLCWGGGCNEDVIRSLMLPTGGAWGEIGTVTLRTYPDRAEAKLRMIDMVWHDALKPGERRPKVYDAIVADQDGDRIVFPYERPMLRQKNIEEKDDDNTMKGNKNMNGKTILTALALGAALQSAADRMSVRRIFREPRVTRGNTNIKKIQPIDWAWWIGMPGESGYETGFYKFRREFEVKEGEGALTIDVSGDERYYLVCDGAFVSRGPNRADVPNWQYNTYELKLAPGRHVLEATVWKTNWDGPLAQLSWRSGFVLKASEPYHERLTTGIAKWRVGRLSGIEPAGKDNGAWGAGSQWLMTGTGYLAAEPAEWKDAIQVGEPAGAPTDEIYGSRTVGWMLYPSQLSDQTEDVVRPGRIAAVTTEAPWRGKHVYAEAETKGTPVADFAKLLQPGGAVTLPARSKFQVAWDLGRYICAYPVLKMKGAKGARLSWNWTEASLREKDDLKGGEPGARDAIVGRWLGGFGDTFVCDGEREGVFQPPWFRCGKWCRLDVETGDAPLVISDLHLIESRYPLETEGAFASPQDATLEGIRRISARAMQMCCHEMLFDCPYYEQQMYPGDTRVQLNVLSAMSRDERMIKRAIELYDLGTRDDGQCPFNWPTRGLQEGATYTLCYLLMYGDYVMNHADRAWLRARLPGLRRTMSGMELYENADGLLENMPGWQFMDWVPGWSRGVAPGGQFGGGVNAEANLFWVLAMKSTALVERALGNELQARYWEEKAAKLGAKVIATFWDEGRGLFADTPAKKDFSEHAQCLALLGDVLPADKAKTCFGRLIADADLRRTTVYFSYYLFECYFKFGRGDLFLKRLDLWRTYVAKGLTTTQEAPDGGKNGQEESRSDCHAWGAHPIWFMQTGLAGIRSAAPFFEKVLVAPCPGSLAELTAKHPHPHGFVEVDLKFEGGKASGTVKTPVAGVFRYGGREVALVAGENVIR